MLRWSSLLVMMLIFASPAHATCNKFLNDANGGLSSTPSSVDIDTEQTQQYGQDYDIHLVNVDDAGCAPRQFCFYPSLITNQPGSISLTASHLLITPVGDWICVNLNPQDSAHFTLTVTQDQNGTTPPHRYQIYSLLRSGPNYTYPLIGSTLSTYNRRDEWQNTCKGS